MKVLTGCPTEQDVRQALDTVMDPELDEAITDLGFVRSIEITDQQVLVHLRLPTSFCSPNFAYLMASDAKGALGKFGPSVVIELDDHHDSDLINRGLALDAGYKGTFGSEAEESLDELRQTFRGKAHTAAMERALMLALGMNSALTGADAHRLTIDDLPESREKQSLLLRRAALGRSIEGSQPVLVDEAGLPVRAEHSELQLRRARSVRISIDGNAHFCRGLLRTRYPESASDQTPRPDATRPALLLISISTKSTEEEAKAS